jgi:hypothetical protein
MKIPSGEWEEGGTARDYEGALLRRPPHTFLNSACQRISFLP